MPLSVRRLHADDAEAARRLGQEAFGVPPAPPTGPARLDRPGAHYLGAYEGATLVARLLDQEYDSWFGGVPVPTAGIAGVTVAVEHRGQGTLRALFEAALAGARERGALVSTLFPTAPRIYRRLGYEVVADYARVRVPTWALGTVARPTGTRVRRAGPEDFDAVRAVYDRWAAQQNGPLTRRGPSFPATAEDVVASVTGVTLAVDEGGEVVGYVSWDRGEGYGDEAVLAVHDLLATTADGYRALLAALGSNSSVTASTTIWTSGHDVVRTFLPSAHWAPVDTRPYMLRVLDVPAALTARRYPRAVATTLGFRLAGDMLADLDGGYRLEVTDGAAACDRAEGAGDRTFTPRGLALLYSGTQSCANLRFAGQLTGGDPEDDLVWDALFGGRQTHIRDYF